MKIIVFILLFTVASCNRSLNSSFEYNKSTDPWVDAFKDRFFFAALTEAYKGDSTIFLKIKKIDAFNPYDGLGLSERLVAEELGKKFILNMPPPAMCKACGDSLNYYMASSLHYYKSKELDAIARKYYKEHVNADKKAGLYERGKP